MFYFLELNERVSNLASTFDAARQSSEKRAHLLERAHAVSEKFWDDINALMTSLAALKESLDAQEPPALEPSAIREQQDALEALREELEHAQPDRDAVHEGGEELINLIGEPDKPEVEKTVEEADVAWNDVSSKYDTRQALLDDALARATEFHDQLMHMLSWVQEKETELRHQGPVATTEPDVLQQLRDLHDLEAGVHPKSSEVQAINQTARDLLREGSPAEQVGVVKEPVGDMNRRWDVLVDGIASRKARLQRALLSIGSFDSALAHLLEWLARTQKKLDAMTSVGGGDPKMIEIELAKLRVSAMSCANTKFA